MYTLKLNTTWTSLDDLFQINGNNVSIATSKIYQIKCDNAEIRYTHEISAPTTDVGMSLPQKHVLFYGKSGSKKLYLKANSPEVISVIIDEV